MTVPKTKLPKPMTSDQLRQALKYLGLSQMEAARRLPGREPGKSLDPRTFRRWLQPNGWPVPAPMADIIRGWMATEKATRKAAKAG